MEEGERVQEAEAVAELQGAGAERNEVEGHMAEVAEWPKQGGGCEHGCCCKPIRRPTD